MEFQEMKERIGDKFGVPLILNKAVAHYLLYKL